VSEGRRNTFQTGNVPVWKTTRPETTKSLPWIVIPRDATVLSLIADRINILLHVQEQLAYTEAERRFWESLQAHVNAISSK